MSEHVLRGIIHKDEYTRLVEREINAWFREAMWAPLQIVLAEAGVKMDPRYQAIKFDEFGRTNATATALQLALNEGRIYYADGVFSGKFSASISKELKAMGATFDRGARTFRIAQSMIPLELRGILATAALTSATVTHGLLEVLRQMEVHITEMPTPNVNFDAVLSKIEADLGRQFYKTTLSITPEDVGITPKISAETRAIIDEGFTRNLNLSIKDFAQERIPELRKKVEQNSFEFGGRTDRLAKIIEAEFGVDQRKAEFLAVQETGLLVSKYRAAKYGQIGIKEYIWSTSHDKRVRQSHRLLDGKKFSFSTGANVSPPGKPSRYCNPGEDYRCRCVARPVINLAELAA
jgi:SPP1 gp7 family putative phage head morphogenesis protein